MDQSDGIYNTYTPVAWDLWQRKPPSDSGRFTAINPRQLGYNYYVYCPYYGRVRYIPVCSIYHMYVCILMSIPLHLTCTGMGEWDTSQSVPYYYHKYMYMCILTCTSIPSQHTMGEWDTSQSVPYYYHMYMYMYMCILTCISIPSQHTMGEWDTSQSVPYYTTCIIHNMCVSLCLSHYIIPYGRVGHIPVCPILIPHVHVRVYP